MLRTVVSKTTPALRRSGCRSYAAATSKQKRSLSKEQLAGGKLPAEKAVSGSSASPPPPPPPPSSSDGGDNTMATGLLGALALVGGAGAAHYFGVVQIPGLPAVVTAPTTGEEDKQTVVPEASVVVKKEEAPTTTPEEEKVSKGGPNKVVNIQVPEGEKTKSAPVPELTQPNDGNKVTMEVYKHAAAAQEEANSPTVAVENSIKELRDTIEMESSEALKRAQKAVTNNLDTSLFEDLDGLNESQLKGRVAQLAAELKERTRWEALRLKEFLAMKEKETSENYLEILQKQRLEAEADTARRLRQQEHELVQSANASLREQQGSIEGLLNDAVAKVNSLHDQEKTTLLQQTKEEIRAATEQEYLQKLEGFKTEALAEMERKVMVVEALKKKLRDVEAALQATQSIQSGSIQAHRLSAAALALAEKMETNKSALVELQALQLAVDENDVIAAALSSVPEAIKSGIPTLPELQAKFEKAHQKCRQAANVPVNELGVGLEGQLMGMLFSTVKFPPNPEEKPPAADADAAEFVLVRAKQYVQTGELERAVEQLEKLKGQTAFTIQGWKQDAANRVAVEKALKVIKMECALLNKNMSEQAS